MNDYKLIKRSNTLLRSVFVYRGRDHLLLVEQFMFLQYYNRLFFSEISGIIAAKTDHFDYYFSISLMLFIILQGVYFNNHSNICLSFSILFLGIALINVILGKTCKICIITKVQEKRIGGIFRWRQWIKIKKILVPLIEQEQGMLHPDDTFTIQKNPETNSSS
jgi:hypothetical protein